MSDKKLYREALEKVRDEFIEEVRRTLEVNIAIRDDPKVPARDRINASKNILHIMGTPRPAEVRPTVSDKKPDWDPASLDPSPEERERVESILREN